MRYKKMCALLSIIVLFASLSVANAEIQKVVISVDGLACPFCAYGVEKKLKRVEGVKSIDIMMNEGIVILEVEEGLSISVDQVPRAIRDSGFSLRTMKVKAQGTIQKEGEALLFRYATGEAFSLKNVKPEFHEKLSSFLDSGESVLIEGTVEASSEGLRILSPESIEKSSK